MFLAVAVLLLSRAHSCPESFFSCLSSMGLYLFVHLFRSAWNRYWMER